MPDAVGKVFVKNLVPAGTKERMAAMVRSEYFTRSRVPMKMRTSLPGERPSKRPETMPARKRAVPVAESQFKAYVAGSAVGLGTTGGPRCII